MSDTHVDLKERLEAARAVAAVVPRRLPRIRDPLLGLEAARAFDLLLRNIVAGYVAVDLAIGEGLAALNVGWRKMQLGYSNLGDYAREELGINASTAAKKERLARRLANLPLLREAVRSGEVTIRKAEIVAPHVTVQTQGVWILRTREATVRQLRAELQAEPDPDDEQWENFVAEVPRVGSPVVKEGLRMGGIVLGARSTAAERVSAFFQEYLSSHVVPEPDDPLDDVRLRFSPIEDGEAAKKTLEEQSRRWANLVKVQPLRAREFSDEIDPWRIDAELKAFVKMRESWDELVGSVAKTVKSSRAWALLDFTSFGHYCDESLGLAERTVSQRVALEYDLERFPALRTALQRGRITYEKARVIARHAEENHLETLIAQAEKTTCVALRNHLRERSEAQMCARGRYTIPVPVSIKELAKDLLRTVRAAVKRCVSAGEALMISAGHFVVTWVEHLLGMRNTLQKRIVARDRHRCQVPGCSRPATHVHHIEYRSHGGSDDPSNLISLCTAHHLRGIHDGRMDVSGKAPDELVWEFGLGRSYAAGERRPPPTRVGARCGRICDPESSERDDDVTVGRDTWRRLRNELERASVRGVESR